ncbi:hypothetical protein ACTXGO_01010 [Psychrobacter sp. T6-1]|uniref:hypothetical protein n=1 Tax=Psychrobacter sp. T6-1 TaxID=3457447 RepID=UPI003FD28BF4
MLTDKDIRDIKELAERSGMDYFVNVRSPHRKLYDRDWQVLTTESGQYNKNYNAVLYQLIPFNDRMLYACVARWYSYPNLSSFERTLVCSEMPLQGLNLHDIYDGLHPKFKLKKLRAMDGAYHTGYRPPLIIIDDLITQ